MLHWFRLCDPACRFGKQTVSCLSWGLTALVGCAPNSSDSVGAAGTGGKTTAENTTAGGTASSGGSSNGNRSNGGSDTGSRGGASAASTSCIPSVDGANLHPGNFDYETCSHCHQNFWGGWLYNNTSGDTWIGGATVTLTNDDGTQVSAVSARDGFFFFEGKVGTKFKPCVSKCPDTLCATRVHDSPDCQSSGCHNERNRLIYLPQQGQGTGGTSSGTNCKAPASGGPRVHSAEQYDGNYKSCPICHDSNYIGGYVYDGLTSNKIVSMATVTIEPANGKAITVVTGPGGMFLLGDYNPTTTTIPLTAPYKACVSKCPKTICSATSTHTTTDNCGDCHNDQLRIYLN